jgi:hypothetical protein
LESFYFLALKWWFKFNQFCYWMLVTTTVPTALWQRPIYLQFRFLVLCIDNNHFFTFQAFSRVERKSRQEWGLCTVIMPWCIQV